MLARAGVSQIDRRSLILDIPALIGHNSRHQQLNCLHEHSDYLCVCTCLGQNLLITCRLFHLISVNLCQFTEVELIALVGRVMVLESDRLAGLLK